MKEGGDYFMNLTRRIINAIYHTVSRILGINLWYYYMTSKKDNTKALLHFSLQLFIVVFSLLILYILPHSVAQILTLYMPVNNTTLIISPILLLVAFIIALVIPFVIGYYYNKFALNQLKKSS